MRSSMHNSVCTSCFITSCSALHLIHIFSSCSYGLYRQVYSPSSVFLCFLFLISCQAGPSFLISSTASRTILFWLSHSCDCVAVYSKFSDDTATDVKQSYYLMFIGLCIIAIVDEWKTNLMSLAILFHLLCAQHVSDINISIFRSLRLC